MEEFINGQESEKTKKKTKHDVNLCHEFLVLKGETRQMDELTPQELNKFLNEFLITVHKKEDNEEYEPNSLRAFFASFERYLKAVDKTRNMEHSGKFRNIPEHEKII